MTTMGNDCASNYDLWGDFVAAIRKMCVPSTTSKSRCQHALWITHTIIKAARIKRALLKKSDEIPVPCCYAKGRRPPACIKSSHTYSTSRICSKDCVKSKGRPKSFLGIHPTPQIFFPPSMLQCQRAATDSPKEIAKLLANQFSDVYTTGSSTARNQQCAPLDEL